MEDKFKQQENAYHVYKMVNVIYTGFLIHRDEKLYLGDTTIYEDALTFKVRSITSRVYLYGKDFFISLSMNTRLYGKNYFNMYYDFGLSDDTCIWLYEYNFGIVYNVPILSTGHATQDIAAYDRQAITRRHTIKNIIGDE